MGSFVFEIGALSGLIIKGKTVYLHLQTSGFNISGIQFQPGPLGTREVCIRFRRLTDSVRFEVIAGPPAKLSIPDWDVTRVTKFNDV